MVFLKDRNFLEELNRFPVSKYYAAIMVLDFETEQPLARIEGKVASGSINASRSTSTRRTGSLQLVFAPETYDLTSFSNLLAIDKKIALSIGIENPLRKEGYDRYGDTLWFKQGIFIITGANSSISPSGANVSLQFIDKMGFLNGVCGGTIPATVSLHDKIIIDGHGNTTTLYPKIREIIYEVVHHFGNEHPSRIIIDDVPEYGRQVATWGGSTPAWFAENSGAFVVANTPPGGGFIDQKVLGDDIGYMSTPLTYPGELVMKAGSTVTGILDEIVKTLGNYEYFYDVDGFFHFQQIRNYQKTGQAPIKDGITKSQTPFNIADSPAAEAQFRARYLPIYAEDQFLNEFGDSLLIASASLNPQYSNIKNDFVAWGTRRMNKDEEVAVRYHLAIDDRPFYIEGESLCERDIWEVRAKGGKEVRRYFAMSKERSGQIPSLGEIGDTVGGNVTFTGDYVEAQTYKYDGLPQSVRYQGEYFALEHRKETIQGIKGIPPTRRDYWRKIHDDEEEIFLHSPSLARLPAGKNFEWREELYRLALINYNASARGSYYDEELLAEWRNIFNPNDKALDPMSSIPGFVNPHWSDFKTPWVEYFGGQPVPWGGYNVDVVRKPQNIRYWLDIIETNTKVGAFSVPRIGRRTIVVENSKINEVLNREVPDVVFIDGTQKRAEIEKEQKEMIEIGQRYCIVKPDYLPYFKLRNSFGTCYEEIRDLMYTHLFYNASVSITAVPILYLDVNRIVRLNLPELGVTGHYIINSISWQFSQGATMSLQLNESLTIV